MKIYGIRDRLLDYYVQLFLADNDKVTLSTTAEAVNGERGHAIEKAPHHFEIWRLGNIDEKGDVTPDKEYICDCSSLVREPSRPGRGLDRRESRPDRQAPGDHARTGPIETRQGPPAVVGQHPTAETEAAPQGSPSAPGRGTETHSGPGGIPGHSER